MPTHADINRDNLLRDQALQRAHALRERAIQRAWEGVLGHAKALLQRRRDAATRRGGGGLPMGLA